MAFGLSIYSVHKPSKFELSSLLYRAKKEGMVQIQNQIERREPLNRHLTTSSLVMLFMLFSMSAHAKDIDRGKSLGFAQAIGGPNGLAMGLAIGDFHFETILGSSYFSGNSSSSATFISVGLASHYHLLRAQHAALSVGGRLNLGTGSSVQTSTADGGLQTEVLTSDIVQWGVDIPLRIYWFPAESISLHTEFGIAILFGTDGDLLFGQVNRNGFTLDSGEIAVRVFEEENAFGKIGMTFWW